MHICLLIDLKKIKCCLHVIYMLSNDKVLGFKSKEKTRMLQEMAPVIQ